EDTRVPDIVSQPKILFGYLASGLLHESFNQMSGQAVLVAQRRAESNIAIPSFGIGGLDTESDQIAVSGHFLGKCQGGGEPFDGGNGVVGVERAHNRLRIASRYQRRSQTDRSRRAPSCWLGDYIGCRHVR